MLSFDPIVANPGRLAILTALAVDERQEFVTLRQRTNLTDGNLASHAKRLLGAGLVTVDKSFRAGKPVTCYCLTTDGRKALEGHARRVLAAISHRRLPTMQVVGTERDEAIVQTLEQVAITGPKLAA